MARYIGPKGKIEKKYGEPVLGSGKMLERNKPIGWNQKGRRRKKISEYGLQLKEKQKAKYIYGVLEKQFRNTFLKAARQKGPTGELLLQHLERRLDNVVYRIGWASTRQAARQLVTHCHIFVNERRFNIPSALVSPGDTISLSPKYRKKWEEIVQKGVGAKNYSWLSWDSSKGVATFVEIPKRTSIPENINEQSIIELYSKS